MTETYSPSEHLTAASLSLRPEHFSYVPVDYGPSTAVSAPEPSPAARFSPFRGIDIQALDIYSAHEALGWTSAALAERPATFTPPIAVPEVQLNGDAQRLVTDTTAQALDACLGFIEIEARYQFVPVRSITLSAFRDPDEGEQELVLTLHVALGASDALVFWDKLGRRLTAFADTLPPRVSFAIRQTVAIEVTWQDAPAL
jgi:hypothetical protein